MMQNLIYFMTLFWMYILTYLDVSPAVARFFLTQAPVCQMYLFPDVESDVSFFLMWSQMYPFPYIESGVSLYLESGVFLWMESEVFLP